jgi:hypothetical protein
MSSAPELLTLCAASGVDLWEENGRLRYHGAAAVVAPILPDLARFKLALLELLTAPDAPATEPATAPQFRVVAPFLLVPLDPQPAPGAAKVTPQIALNRARLTALDAATHGNGAAAIYRATNEMDARFKAHLKRGGGAAAVWEVALCRALLDLGIDLEAAPDDDDTRRAQLETNR